MILLFFKIIVAQLFLSYSCIVGCSLAAKCSNTFIRQSLSVSACILISNVDFLRGESQPKQSLCGLYSSKMRWNSLLTSVWLRVVQHYKNYEFVTWHAIDWPSWHFTFCTHQAKLGPPAFVLLLDFDRFWGDVSHYQKLHGSDGPKGPFCKICPLIHVSYSISELWFSQNIRWCISFQC